jgi:hypothetical protein
MTNLGNTVRFVAVLRSDGTSIVLPVAITDLPRIVEEERTAGAHVIGDFADFRDADRIVRHSRRGRSRLERRKTA